MENNKHLLWSFLCRFIYDKDERLGKVKTILILLCVFFCMPSAWFLNLRGLLGNLRTLINYSNNKFAKTQLLQYVVLSFDLIILTLLK